MRDQADKLRQIVEDLQSGDSYQSTVIENVTPARVITITSGKGGVGKTNISVNLAISLARSGLRVVILDADFGLSNIDVLLGIVPRYTLAEIIRQDKNILDIISKGPENISFISGGSGLEEMIHLKSEDLDRFLDELSEIDKYYDIIIIDTGAGISENVIRFALAADEVLVITTPEPTSITDSYALIKTVLSKDAEKDIKVVINRTEDKNEAYDVFKRLSLVTKRFLGTDIHYLGCILQDVNVIKSVKTQKPFLIGYPNTNASKYIQELSDKLLPQEEKTNENKGFFRRLAGIFKNHF